MDAKIRNKKAVRKFIALTSALTAAACGGASTRPAQDAASGATATVPSHGNPTVATGMEPTAAMLNNTVETTPTGNNEVAGATANFTPSRVAPVVDRTPSVPDQTNNADNTKINSSDRHDAPTPMESRE